MKLSRQFRASSPAVCPGQINWDYDRAEIIADGVIHAAGIVLGLVGAIVITIVALKVPQIGVSSIFVYAVCLITMLVASATYNMWPISPTKWLLRRFDHSADAFAVTYPGAKAEFAFRRMHIHRTSRSNRLAIVNLEPHRHASRCRGDRDVVRRHFFRMRNEVDELSATFGEAG